MNGCERRPRDDHGRHLSTTALQTLRVGITGRHFPTKRGVVSRPGYARLCCIHDLRIPMALWQHAGSVRTSRFSVLHSRLRILWQLGTRWACLLQRAAFTPAFYGGLAARWKRAYPGSLPACCIHSLRIPMAACGSTLEACVPRVTSSHLCNRGDSSRAEGFRRPQ
jgi:hypothetical protein